MDLEQDMTGNVAAFEQTIRSTIALAEGFEEAEWELATECPGWTVKDQVSHLAGVERMILGDPQPELVPEEEAPHVRNDFGRIMESHVAERRGVPGAQIVEELREALDRRMAELKGIDPDQPMMCPDGKMGTYARFMMFRAFDAWTHEQDIRRAVGRPGNLDAPAADRAWFILGRALPGVVGRRAQAEPGQSVIFKISGPPTHRRCVLVGDDGRARVVDSVPDPTVTLDLQWPDYVRLSAGRCDAEATEVVITGDPGLATKVLSNMAVTP